MKSKNLYLYFYFSVLTTLLTFSCTKEIKLEDDFQPKLVIHGILVAGEPADIQVQSNFSIFQEATTNWIANAQAHLYDGGSLVASFVHDSLGYYSSTFRPETGHTYELKVTSPGYNEVRATTTIPETIDHHVNSSTKNDSENKFIHVEIAASNQISYFALAFFTREKVYETWPIDEQKSYYVYRHSNMAIELDNCVDFFCSQEYLEKTEPPLRMFYRKEQPYNRRFRTFYSRDYEKSFGNKNIVYFSNKSFLGNNYLFENAVSAGSPDVMVTFFHLSPELYIYLRAISAQISTSRDLFVSPVSIVSNIKNGLGCFGSCSIKLNRLYP